MKEAKKIKKIMSSPVVILGSSSKWRKSVLEGSLPGLISKQMSADIDEKAIRHPDAEVLCVKIAQAKADELVPQIKELSLGTVLLITGDQVVRFGSEIREKPETAEENYEFLTSYTPDTPLETCSSVVITSLPSGKQVTGVDVCRITFNEIPKAVQEIVVAKGETLQCCGGFVIEDSDLSPFIKSIDGDIDSVQGMPINLTKKLLAEIGFST